MALSLRALGGIGRGRLAGERTPARSLILWVGLLFMCMGPLQPLHLPPWPSFHSEALTVIGFGLVCLSWVATRTSTPWPWLGIGALGLSVVPLLQAAGGLIYFWGDAWTATVYLLLFALSLAAGAALVDRHARDSTVDFAAAGLVLSALLSVWVALDQWLELRSLGGFAANAGQRQPFGNLGQPNQFATWVVLGWIALLVLYQRRLVGGRSLVLATAFLFVGVTASQSRAGSVEILVVVLVAWLLRKRAGLRIGRRYLAGAALAVVVLALAWPAIGKLLIDKEGRAAEQKARAASIRLIHWSSMVDAIGRRPWLGYGWNQVSVAQNHVAPDHAVSHEQIDHSHDVALDLLVWNGIPIGAACIGGIGWWMWRQLRRCRSADAALALAAILAVTVHGLLEFPLEYAYFLLPVGLLMGAVDRGQATPGVRLGPAVNAGAFAIAVCLVGWMSMDYMVIEENNRILRFEMAGFNAGGTPSEAPDVDMLTQRREILRFARTAAKRGMSPEDVEWMRKISERFPFPPVLLRYSIAAGLNGHPEAAARSMAVLCKTGVRERCEEGLEAWKTMSSERFPELSRVPMPLLPPPLSPPPSSTTRSP